MQRRLLRGVRDGAEGSMRNAPPPAGAAASGGLPSQLVTLSLP